MTDKRENDDKKIEVHDIISSTGVGVGQNIDISVTQGVDREKAESTFARIQKQLDKLESHDAQTIEDAKVTVKELERESSKGDMADEGILARKFRMLARMGEDILEVVTATLVSPLAGISMVVQKIAQKAREEAGLTPPAHKSYPSE